jgi:hypothetical protein
MLKGIQPDLAFGVTSLRDDDELNDIISRAENAFIEATKQEYGKIQAD